jgi:hypothetical protein
VEAKVRGNRSELLENSYSVCLAYLNKYTENGAPHRWDPVESVIESVRLGAAILGCSLILLLNTEIDTPCSRCANTIFTDWLNSDS